MADNPSLIAVEDLVRQSPALDDNERQVLLKLLPLMGSDDLNRVYLVLTMEASVNSALPQIVEGIGQNLLNMHQQTSQGYNIFQDKMLRRAEGQQHGEELDRAEETIRQL